MSFRSDRFNGSMRSLDAFVGSFDDPSKIAALSDRGAGVERMLDEIDHPEGPDDGTTAGKRKRRLHAAEMRLHRAGLGHLVPVLRLIARNGSDRKESIWELARGR